MCGDDNFWWEEDEDAEHHQHHLKHERKAKRPSSGVIVSEVDNFKKLKKDDQDPDNDLGGGDAIAT